MKHTTCPETVKLDLLVSDQADAEAVGALLAHIETCPTCQAHVEERNKFYAISSYDSAGFESKTDVNDSEEALIERFKRLPGLNRYLYGSVWIVNGVT